MDPNTFYTKNLPGNQKYTIGEHTYGNPGIYDWNDGTQLIVGKYCSFAANIVIILGGNHRVDWVTTYPFPAIPEAWPEAADIQGHPASKGDVVIGNDVWIGYGVTILSGVHIGDGAVLAACSVITKDVPPYTIVGGNPAKVIKPRFDEATIKKLVDLKWWDWPEERIRKHVTLLCSPNIDKLIRKRPLFPRIRKVHNKKAAG